MRNPTVILVSHHVQLCAPGAAYIVALDNGRVHFEGTRDEFYASGVLNGFAQSGTKMSWSEVKLRESRIRNNLLRRIPPR
jgi:ABC-type enterochelin transport system ATPase subunit